MGEVARPRLIALTALTDIVIVENLCPEKPSITSWEVSGPAGIACYRYPISALGAESSRFGEWWDFQDTGTNRGSGGNLIG